MIGNRKIQKRNNRLIGTLLGAVLAFATAAGHADETPAGVMHFMDSSTDRNPLLTAFPKYPSIARRDRIQGEATVCFKIKSDGRLSRVKLANASHRIFAKPAVRAMRKSTFEPLAPGQILATARTCRTFRFRLEPIVVDNSTT